MASGVILAAVATVVAVTYLNDVPGFDRHFHAQFKQVRSGLTQSQVLALLGRPDAESDHFYLGQTKGFEPQYEAARLSGAKRYLIWRKGIDLVYAVGFNEQGQVVVASYGGT